MAAAVHNGSFLNVLGQLQEVLAHHEDGGTAHQHGDEQTGIGVDQTPLLHVQVVGDDRHVGGDHHSHQDQVEQESSALEIKAGEGTRPFYIYADEQGKVADLQAEDSTHKEKKYDLTHTVVHNSKGELLPSTGGKGTFWLITIGTLLAIGFAVFLITHKKMSVYND